MKISIIVAADLNGLIGIGKEIPWHYTEDMKLFKERTIGDGNNMLLFGGNTFYDLYSQGKINLYGRRKLVITHRATPYYDQFGPYSQGIKPSVILFNNIDKAVDLAKIYNPDELFICGGATIYDYFWYSVYIEYIYYTEINDKITVNNKAEGKYIGPVPANFHIKEIKEFDGFRVLTYENNFYKEQKA
jgi:dihydrofolate reductase